MEDFVTNVGYSIFAKFPFSCHWNNPQSKFIMLNRQFKVINFLHKLLQWRKKA